MYFMGASDRLFARLRQAEIQNFSGADEIADRARDILHRHGRVDAMLIEKIDAIGLQPLERRLGHLADMLWPAVDTDTFSVLKLEAEFRGKHDPVPMWF